MPGRDYHFDDFKVGDRFESAGITFTEGEIIDFALRYDPQPFHIDVEAAKASPFGGLIASGFQTLALAFRLFYQTGVLTSANLGGPGFDDLRWLKPVRPGDTIRAAVEVVEMRPSRSKPDRGTVRLSLNAINQRGETVMTSILIAILRRRQG